jgi:hypothetical protein
MRSASRLAPIALGTLVSVSLASAVEAAERVPFSALDHADQVLLGAVNLAAGVVAVVLAFGIWSVRGLP